VFRLLAILLRAPLVILGASVLCFFLVDRYAPDSAAVLAGKNANAVDRQQLANALGHNQSFWPRYAGVIQHVLRGDLGRSELNGERVSDRVMSASSTTALLIVPGYVLGYVIALLLALFARPGMASLLRKLEVICMSCGMLIIAVSVYAIACTPFGLQWLPSHGLRGENFAQTLLHLVAPTLTLIVTIFGSSYLYFDELFSGWRSSSHYLSGKALGLPMHILQFQSVLRPAFSACVTRVAYTLPAFLFSGSLFLESIYGLNGLGGSLVGAVQNGDRPMILGLCLSIAAIYIFLDSVLRLFTRSMHPNLRQAAT
jgi:peptide/nickel transport system permease protein